MTGYLVAGLGSFVFGVGARTAYDAYGSSDDGLLVGLVLAAVGAALFAIGCSL